MYCPDCGKENDHGQAFCRTCGLNLKKSAESIDEQRNTAGDRRIKAQTKRLIRGGRLALAVMPVMTLLLSLLIWFVGDSAGFSTTYRVLIISAIVMIGLLITIPSFLLLVFLRVKEGESIPMRGAEIQAKEDAPKILEEKPFTPVTSVTENPAEYLHVENKTKKL